MGYYLAKAIRWTVLLTVAFLSWKVVPVYAAALRFNFALSEACKTGAMGRLSLPEIRDNILFKARQLGLPIGPRNIDLQIQNRLIRARVSYQVPVELGSRQLLLNFQATAEEVPLVIVEGGPDPTKILE